MNRIVNAALTLVICLAAFGAAVSPRTVTVPDVQAEITQSNNKPLCVGLLNIGACNTVAVQHVSRSSAPADGADLTLVLVCVLLILGASVVLGRRLRQAAQL